jgi:tRNA-specific 2-thiouridylase
MNKNIKKKAKSPERSRRVVVAMSGGVDSSVSAALLKRAGFEVVGVYMRQWSPEILGKECLWKEDRQDAMRVCAKLGIPFLTWDFSKDYEKHVGKYMIDSYKKGITPNPDVMCNKVIKFGLFFDRAIKEGADFVATGHYARIEKGKLLKAKDMNKDQTYFLYTISKNQLDKIIFPIGDLIKPEVRKLAKKFGLQNANKKDSQGVCFIGQFDMKEFLKIYIKPKIGKIFFKGSPSTGSGRSDDKIIGTHDGVYYYTIGQRHGLNIKDGGGPYYVVKKDIKNNIIFVGKEKDLATKKTKIINISWINKPEKFPISIDARTRYRAPLQKAKLYKNGDLVFNKSERAVTSGQSAVFYRGQEVLGGGVIK